MKLLNTTTLLLATAAVHNVGLVVDAATAACEGTCEIPLDMSCTDAIAKYDFEGDCCSLKEVDGNCTLMTTSDCYFQVKGETGCTTDANGNQACVVPGVAYTAFSDEPCPQSEFEIPTTADAEPPAPEASGGEGEGEASTTFTTTAGGTSASTPAFMLSFASFILLLLQTTWDMVESVTIDI